MRFSVCQFFENDTYEWVRENVDADEAVKAFQHYTNNVATKIGVIKRVIITDQDDYVTMEWQHGKGVTFPPPGK
jgi:hypothetical protein